MTNINETHIEALPHDIPSEQAALGAMILAESAREYACPKLLPESFYRLVHGEIFSAMKAMHTAGVAFDLVLLRNELMKRNILEKAGGVEYLTVLMEAVASSANIEAYCAEVLHHAERRRIIEAALNANLKARDLACDPQDISRETIHTLEGIETPGDADTPSAADAMPDLLDEMTERAEGKSTGIPMPWPELAGVTGELQPGHLCIVSARQKAGKTALAVALATDWSVTRQLPVLFVSREMRRTDILKRIMANLTGVDSRTITGGKLGDLQWETWGAAEKAIKGAPIYIDSETRDLSAMLARARREVRRRGVRVVVVDYLQLIALQNASGFYEQVAIAAQSLKDFAMSEGVVVLGLSQVTIKEDGRIVLRHAQEIEQCADLVLLLRRLPQYEGLEGQSEPCPAPRVLSVKLNRHGPDGDVKLMFDGRTCRFTPVERFPETQNEPVERSWA